jgi:Uma2 family endonuclease
MNAVQEAPTPQPVAITVDQFRLLDENGAFDQFSKTELIEGVIYAMQGQHRPHAYAKSELAFRLREQLRKIGSRLYPIVEGSVEMGRHSVPEPDISITAAPDGEGYMPLSSIALAVEVADSSAAFDLGKKALVYARHGVPEYWVLDIPARAVHQLTGPGAEGYRERKTVPLGGSIASATIQNLVVETDGLA